MVWLTTTPHLHTRRPSPTTIEYTVSTLPPLTLPLHILLTSTHLLRLFLLLSIPLILYAKYVFESTIPLGPLSLPITTAPPPNILSIAYLSYLVQHLLGTQFGSLYLSISQLSTTILLPLLAITVLLLLPQPHTHERLLAIRGLGLQVSSSPTTYLASTSTRFIPTSQIQDIFINEAFRGFEVRFVLVIVVEAEEELVVVFPRLLPGMAVVERVWRGVRGCLFEESGDGEKGEGVNDWKGILRSKAS